MHAEPPVADQLRGTARADTLHGLEGDDSADGRGGPDRFLGGPGSDRLQSAFDLVADDVRCARVTTSSSRRAIDRVLERAARW